jgi:uncharacterized membrane protein
MGVDLGLWAVRAGAGVIEVGRIQQEAAMQNSLFMIILWLVCGATTIVAATLAGRSRQARYIGRAAVGVLFIAGGALLHVVNLATGGDYAGFADPAHFGWVTNAWNAIVVPDHVLFIGLLAVFEATAGVLAISGGRRTQLGYLAVIAFYLALWLFGWIETVWVLIMLPAMLMLLWAERHADAGTHARAPAAALGHA